MLMLFIKKTCFFLFLIIVLVSCDRLGLIEVQIEGAVFHDVNTNHKLDSTETNIPGYTITSGSYSKVFTTTNFKFNAFIGNENTPVKLFVTHPSNFKQINPVTISNFIQRDNLFIPDFAANGFSVERIDIPMVSSN